MTDFILTPTARPRPAKPARRQSSLAKAALAVLAECGQMTKPELVAAVAARQADLGKQPYPCNIYVRINALVDAGQIESRRMDKATWLALPGSKPGKRGRRQVISGHAIIRRGQAKFTAKAPCCPAFSGAAVLTFIK